MLFSDGLEGPDQSMRPFFSGLVALLIGGTVTISKIAPKAAVPLFAIDWLALLVVALVALYRKYDRPA